MATVQTVITPKKKSRRLLKFLGFLVVLTVALGGLFFTRPLLVVRSVSQVGMWIHGIHSQNVQLGQYRIHYLVAGEGRPLVLVHGLGGSADNWLTMIPQFTAKGFHVYALDLLGYGHSDKPDVDYAISMQSDLLLKFLDSQDCSSPISPDGRWEAGSQVDLQWIIHNEFGRSCSSTVPG